MSFPRELVKKWGKEDGWKCKHCGKKWADGWILEADHILPSSLGGKDVRENFQLLCVGCHYRKHKAIEIGGRVSAQLIKTRLDKTGGRWRK